MLVDGFFGVFFTLGNFLVVRYQPRSSFGVLKHPLDGSFRMILVSLAMAREAILPFDVFLA